MPVVIQRGDPNSTKKKFIAAIIEKYQRDNPEDWVYFVESQKQERNRLHKETGASLDGNIQLMFSIPKKLIQQLDLVSLDDTGVTIEKDPIIWPWILENYPEFQTPRKI